MNAILPVEVQGGSRKGLMKEVTLQLMPGRIRQGKKMRKKRLFK